MNAKKKGLGRGLEVLLGGSAEIVEAAKAPGVPSTLPLTALQAGKYQPRTRMDEGALQDLAASIRAQGLMQPILVRAVGPGRYEIIAGERRFRAAGIAGLTEVPVLVKEVADESAAAMALIENIQREDLNPLEEAHGIARLIRDFDFTHEQAAEALGRSRSAVSNLLRLLNLAAPVQTMLMAGDIDMGHARALLAVDAGEQVTLANQVIGKRLSVRDTEKLVAAATKPFALKPLAGKGGKGGVDADTARLSEDLSDSLGVSVQIRANARGKGQMLIKFATLDELDRVLERLRGDRV